MRVEKSHDVTAVEELGDGIHDGCKLESSNLRDILGRVERQGADGDDEDGCGEEDKADEPVFVVVWAFCAVDAQEYGDACGREKDEYAHGAPGGTCESTREHPADPTDGEEGGEK